MQASASRLVCSTLAFRHLPVEAALEAVCAAGFSRCDVVGIPGYCEHISHDGSGAEPVEAWAQRVRRFPLGVDRLQTHVPAPCADQETIAAVADHCFRAAQAVGARGVVFGVGRASDRPPVDPDAVITAAGARFSPLARAAAARGLGVSFEAPHRGSLVHTAREALALADACAQPNVGLVFDVAHQLRAGLPLVAAVQLLAGRIDHVHLRDQRQGRGCYPLGTGEVDFAALFRALAATGYGGSFALEFPDAAGSTDEAIELLRRSREHLRIHLGLT